MWILTQDCRVIINSNQTKNFGMRGTDLWAEGNVIVGSFQTEDEAKKELKQIYDALIAGQESYSVG